MKHLILLCILFCCAKTIHSQNIEVPSSKGMIDNIQIVKPQSIKKLPEAIFLYNMGQGKVYALPQDNMPCVVPYIHSNMPVANVNIRQFRNIPNALPEQKLIPQTEVLIVPSTKR